MTKGFYEHMHEVPNPHPERKTKGTLEEFDHHARLLADEALRRTRIDNVEYDVWPATSVILAAIPLYPEKETMEIRRNYE